MKLIKKNLETSTKPFPLYFYKKLKEMQKRVIEKLQKSPFIHRSHQSGQLLLHAYIFEQIYIHCSDSTFEGRIKEASTRTTCPMYD